MSTLSQFMGTSPIKSIQRGITSTTVNQSTYVNISAVNTSKSFIVMNGFLSSYTSSGIVVQAPHINFNGSSQLVLQGGGTVYSGNNSWQVIEWV